MKHMNKKQNQAVNYDTSSVFLEEDKLANKPPYLVGRFKPFRNVCFAIFAIVIAYSVMTHRTIEPRADIVLESKISTTISTGALLLAADRDLGPQDYTITHASDQEETKIWIWDYAAEDGDYVQVLVNGNPISDAFMIKHRPREFVVPAVGDVQIKGIRDGGGGITYAVKYELNQTSYFNSAPLNECNTYTLIKE